MTYRSTADLLITDARVDGILAELNESGAGPEHIDHWAARSDIKPDRVVHGPDITYVRLAGQAEEGGPVVLMHFERMWERAIHRHASSRNPQCGTAPRGRRSDRFSYER